MKKLIMNIELLKYKKSINKSKFTNEQITVIWEFYVTKALVDSAGQKRSIQDDYGWNKIPIKEMRELAKFNDNNYKVLLADKIDGTLKNMNLKLENNIITDIENTRAVFIAPYIIEDDKMPKNRKSEGEVLLEHIRNSLAHGGTYFFENDMMLLEDKNGNRITARILIKQKTLLDWIKLIDKNQNYYIIH